MKRSTLSGIGLSLAALALPASLALAQAAESSSGPPTSSSSSSSSLSPAQVEQRIRYAEHSQASAQTRLKKAEQEYDQARDAAAELERKLHALTQRAETSRSSLSKAASHLDEEAEALALEQAGADARQQALEVVIAQQAKHAEAAVKDDPVAAELQKVVDARAAQSKRTEQLYKTGAVDAPNVDGAAAALAEARARLAERRQQSAAAAGGAALADWNRELLNLSVANAERHAKLKFLEDRRQGLAEALQIADGLSRFKDTMNNAERDRGLAKRDLDNAEELLGMLRATPTTKPQRN
jgi:chromosome segregation ATPase